jgi:hypothetical protein
MGFMGILILFVVSSAEGSSKGAKGDYGQQLMRAQTSNEILRIQSHHEFRVILRLACEQELKRARAPISCFELLHLDRMEKRSPRQRTDRMQTELTTLCGKAAESLAISPNLTIPASVPRTCRLQLRRAQKIITYKNASGWPRN